MQWLNEPKVWTATGDRLSLVTGEKTDFWQKTFYGFEHDNGHCYFERVTGDFTAEVSFTAGYEQLYDQAGLMLALLRALLGSRPGSNMSMAAARSERC